MSKKLIIKMEEYIESTIKKNLAESSKTPENKKKNKKLIFINLLISIALACISVFMFLFLKQHSIHGAFINIVLIIVMVIIAFASVASLISSIDKVFYGEEKMSKRDCFEKIVTENDFEKSDIEKIKSMLSMISDISKDYTFKQENDLTFSDIYILVKFLTPEESDSSGVNTANILMVGAITTYGVNNQINH